MRLLIENKVSLLTSRQFISVQFKLLETNFYPMRMRPKIDLRSSVVFRALSSDAHGGDALDHLWWETWSGDLMKPANLCPARSPFWIRVTQLQRLYVDFGLLQAITISFSADFRIDSFAHDLLRIGFDCTMKKPQDGECCAWHWNILEPLEPHVALPRRTGMSQSEPIAAWILASAWHPLGWGDVWMSDLE